MKKILFSIACVSGLFANAQDIHFSQFQTQPLTQNPALAGIMYDFSVNVNYKDQWRQIGSPYKTFGASADSKINRKKSDRGFFAAGLNFISDFAGDSKMGTVGANLGLAYHLRVGKHQTLGAGVMAGFRQRTLDYSSLTWGNQYNGSSYDPTLNSGETQINSAFSYGDYAAGVIWSFNNQDGYINVTDNHQKKFNLGFAVHHLSRPKYTFDNTNQRLYMKFVLHGSGVISVADSRFAWLPGFMIYSQGKAKELLIGTLFRIKLQQDSKYTGAKSGTAISLGGYLRARDAISAQVLFEFHQFAIGASYDFNISGLKPATNARGGLELSLRFTNKNPFLDGKTTPVGRVN